MTTENHNLDELIGRPVLGFHKLASDKYLLSLRNMDVPLTPMQVVNTWEFCAALFAAGITDKTWGWSKAEWGYIRTTLSAMLTEEAAPELLVKEVINGNWLIPLIKGYLNRTGLCFDENWVESWENWCPLFHKGDLCINPKQFWNCEVSDSRMAQGVRNYGQSMRALGFRDINITIDKKRIPYLALPLSKAQELLGLIIEFDFDEETTA
jgi:hypothetical protein